jgi:hypothetical protein
MGSPVPTGSSTGLGHLRKPFQYLQGLGVGLAAERRCTSRWLGYRGTLGVADGRSHSDAVVGAMVWSTTASSSADSASRWT